MLITLLQRRLVGWLVALVLGWMLAAGIAGDEGAITAFVEAFLAFFMYVLSEIIKTYLQERERKKGHFVPELQDRRF